MLRATLERRVIEAVVIGGSSGGVAALLQLLPGLPAGFPAALAVVLHIPAGRPSQLAAVFRQRMALPVREAADKEPLASGTVYFAGEGYHLSIERERCFSVSCEPLRHYARPAIDFLLESAADAYGDRLLGIVLTGANQDGAEGLAAIGRAGGLTVVQDPAQAESPLMPNEAIKMRAPDLVLPLKDIHQLLLMLEKN